MRDKSTILERAFAMAESGVAECLVDVKECLQKEGFSQGDLERLDGLILLRQLDSVITSARIAKTADA